ncbi:type III polyketide synthase [Kocuria tytonis]|uniref:Type III polyketide synthase n=1 Tax=Kocuria tytonis TaxID=2054280 RepID=A0A495ADC0_9MICC|nr:3-oxoacyl-[acyl-carrier-protein] synthase III C-terminal domain-containing protein [Kocuria tytonis]RKQ36825.1 type III polyketide synthase [Kocuria tytonis]
MTVRMLTIDTVVPETVIHQEDVTRLFAEQPGMNRLGSRLVRSAFGGAGVATRHTVLPELGLAAATAPHDAARAPQADAAPSPFVDPATGHLLSPGTHARNQLYTQNARELFVTAGRAALESTAPGITAADVTHVVTVSCTGFFAPGPDVRVAKDLGLPADVKRMHLGFMGCNAAFPALQAAATACRADPEAVVLVVCVELCTLHLHVRNDTDTIMGNALFADGAAAAVITARDVPAPGPTMELVDFETTLAPVGEEELAWSVGDEGFEMILGTYVPRIIDDHVSDALAPLLERTGERVPDIGQWAVHPGGRSILDKVESRLGLAAEQMAPSRAVLSEVGNMSSATILFVLERLLSAGMPGTVAAMAFGPGLSIESALLRLVPARDGRG